MDGQKVRFFVFILYHRAAVRQPGFWIFWIEKESTGPGLGAFCIWLQRVGDTPEILEADVLVMAEHFCAGVAH